MLLKGQWAHHRRRDEILKERGIKVVPDVLTIQEGYRFLLSGAKPPKLLLDRRRNNEKLEIMNKA